MTRGILIAGNNSPALTAIAVEAAKRVDRFAAALLPDTADKILSVSSAEIIGWNPGSPIAARTLTLAVENRLGQITDAVLLCDPPALCAQRGQMSHNEIESLVQDQIKGWFLLVKELTAIFRAKKSGTLAMAMSHTNKGDDILAPCAEASFQALTQGLLTLSLNEPFQILGFSPPESGDEAGFAAFIFKVIEENNRKQNGKWHKFGKLGFFGR
jgi:hypothetical protein